MLATWQGGNCADTFYRAGGHTWRHGSRMEAKHWLIYNLMLCPGLANLLLSFLNTPCATYWLRVVNGQGDLARYSPFSSFDGRGCVRESGCIWGQLAWNIRSSVTQKMPQVRMGIFWATWLICIIPSNWPYLADLKTRITLPILTYWWIPLTVEIKYC